MGKRSFRICAGMLAAVIGLLVWLNVTVQRGPEPDGIYPMANAGIEWSGAGYSGIYEH